MINKVVSTTKGKIEGIEEERGYRFLGMEFIRPILLKLILFKEKGLLALVIMIKIHFI